ncbi:helix-turn-helix domain-containing protein [Rhizobium halophytocola]|uniref:Transcriptional regulator with XRE-family HTH domain n=1 Tax=Rhizobium halophytocola TaxID=735519 RepID=A0ABS4E443_9HYPH|nr:transcriptional regulator with XRE-family HTH domain [Rhizobium halophytocola]
MSDETTIGARAKEIRQEARLSQQEMADAIGLSLRAWQKIERNEGVPSGETLLQFKKVGVNPGWVLTGSGPRSASAAGEDNAFAQVDPVLLQRLGDTVQAVFVECKQTPPQRAITFEAGQLYNDLLNRVKDLRDTGMVTAAIEVLRREFKDRLTAAQPGTGKRSG